MSCCNVGKCGGCKALVTIVALLATATTVAAAIGVYMTHYTAEGWVFGKMDGSLAIVAFLLSVMCWLKLVRKICPCCKIAGTCCDGGGCSVCGASPCSCK